MRTSKQTESTSHEIEVFENEKQCLSDKVVFLEKEVNDVKEKMKSTLDELRLSKLDVVLSQQKLEKFCHGAKNIDKMLCMGKTDSDKRGLGYEESLPSAKTPQITKFVKVTSTTLFPKHNMISTTHDHAQRVSYSQIYYCSLCGIKGHIASYCRFVGPYQSYVRPFDGYRYSSNAMSTNVKCENVSRWFAQETTGRRALRSIWIACEGLVLFQFGFGGIVGTVWLFGCHCEWGVHCLVLIGLHWSVSDCQVFCKFVIEVFVVFVGFVEDFSDMGRTKRHEDSVPILASSGASVDALRSGRVRNDEYRVLMDYHGWTNLGTDNGNRKVGRKDSHFLKQKTNDNLSNLGALGDPQICPKLIKVVLESKFNGLSGEFILIDGQLQSLAFEILNVAGNGGREIGFWTPVSGISQRLKVSSISRYSTSKANLGNITWPGESSIAPKGWVIPKSGILRVGVPVIKGFGSELVDVDWNTSTNLTFVTGYCIDVFKAVMERLPYSISYEFVPFQNASSSIARNYNDLIYQVFLQNYDAVVGDITIIANRSLYVDFALPFTESGVLIVVPVKGDEWNNAWIFLKPLTMELWFATGAFVIFIGFVVWILEHRVNDEFRGVPTTKPSPGHDLLVFLLDTSNLTSLLTAQRLQHMVTTVKDLLQNREFYDSPQDFDKGFSLGRTNGGFPAAFDEIPYIDLILVRKYCAKYTKVRPSYRIGGFGFAFQKGSILVPDISRVVLNINSENSLWQTIVIMARHFDTKVDNEDPGTPNVEATSIETSPNNNAPNVEATSIEVSPNKNAPESSPINSSHIGGNLSSLEDQHTLAEQIFEAQELSSLVDLGISNGDIREW
ncbi:hypothetical protein GIB67_030446 [Kingdonia uniflora]|uniref:Ionotropic glutamate receptor C-terminal domain-containing protein n=1 Tax=Kingdonia uniflora TaxID=39325 RepID=A0A7J7NDX5_9MAGN|nr:hypothetical protein GIB67_030446 [Kingdonia uniflora]